MVASLQKYGVTIVTEGEIKSEVIGPATCIDVTRPPRVHIHTDAKKLIDQHYYAIASKVPRCARVQCFK